VRTPGDKGHFSTDIDDDVIRQALEAVEKRSKAEGAEVRAEALADATGATADAPAADAPEAAAPAEASAAPPDPKDQEIESLRAQLELSMGRGRELMQKLKEEHEKLLRTAADLENYKKRAQKEKEEIQKYGSERLLKDLLPVLDNFDRALEHASSASDFDSFKKGVELIRKQFEDVLARHGVKAFSAKGEAFDPTRHEAMSSAETTDMPPNHVFSEVLRGFMLNDRLVRPALVVVSRAPEKPPAATPAPDSPAPEGGSGEGGGGGTPA
jgi:molecular chaperone GrpE